MNRRKFIETSGAAAGAAMLGTVAGAQTLNTGSPVQKTSSAGRIKLGLYSITYGGIWYNGPALTLMNSVVGRRKPVSTVSNLITSVPWVTLWT